MLALTCSHYRKSSACFGSSKDASSSWQDRTVPPHSWDAELVFNLESLLVSRYYIIRWFKKKKKNASSFLCSLWVANSLLHCHLYFRGLNLSACIFLCLVGILVMRTSACHWIFLVFIRQKKHLLVPTNLWNEYFALYSHLNMSLSVQNKSGVQQCEIHMSKSRK